MNKHEVTTTDARRQHEGDAIAQMRAAIQALEAACDDASHGNYKGAAQTAQAARDRLYVVDIELRKAETAALRGKA
jgi:hypothetical protein